MRTKVKALLVLATSIGTLMSFVLPSAHAASFGDALIYSGRAIPLTCDANTEPGTVDSLTAGTLTCPLAGGNGVPLVGGSGTFGFVASNLAASNAATPEVCFGVSDGDGLPPVPEAAACDTGGGTHPGLSASGTYTNITCGTGDAGGTATAYESDSTLTTKFQIPFFSGVGLTVGTTTESDSSGTGALYGVVVLTLDSQAGDFIGAGGICAHGFTSTGASVVIDPQT